MICSRDGARFTLEHPGPSSPRTGWRRHRWPPTPRREGCPKRLLVAGGAQHGARRSITRPRPRAHGGGRRALRQLVADRQEEAGMVRWWRPRTHTCGVPASRRRAADAQASASGAAGRAATVDAEARNLGGRGPDHLRCRARRGAGASVGCGCQLGQPGSTMRRWACVTSTIGRLAADVGARWLIVHPGRRHPLRPAPPPVPSVGHRWDPGASGRAVRSRCRPVVREHPDRRPRHRRRGAELVRRSDRTRSASATT